MRIVIQRVSRASVTIEGELHSAISRGLMVLVGVEHGDTAADAEWLAAKTAALNVGMADISNAEVLAVSQFTLTASTKKGNRPSYIRAAGHDLAVPMYEAYCEKLGKLLNREVKRGVFGADMQVELINDGPVTIIIDSKLKE